MHYSDVEKGFRKELECFRTFIVIRRATCCVITIPATILNSIYVIPSCICMVTVSVGTFRHKNSQCDNAVQRSTVFSQYTPTSCTVAISLIYRYNPGTVRYITVQYCNQILLPCIHTRAISYTSSFLHCLTEQRMKV